MADMDSLYNALRNADAAGDTEGARRLAQYIQETQQGAPIAAPKQAPFSLKDTAVAAGQSALGATKAITEAFGAGNAPAEYLENLQKGLGTFLSPERQAEQQRRAAMEKAAAKSGSALNELGTFVGGVTEAPIQTLAQGVGSMAPTVLLGMGAAAAGAALGAPALLAGGVGLGVKWLVGALQGAGEVKGSVYDAVREGLVQQGMSPDQAKNRAREAQNYIGENWGTIAAGAGLGGVAAGTGAEQELLKKFSKPVAAKVAAQLGEEGATKEAGKGTARRYLEATLKEAAPEGAQGGQGQYAENVAMTRAGMATPAMQGVLGSTARDAAMGALAGAAVHPFTGTEAPAKTPPPPPAPQIAPEAPAGTQGTLFTPEEMGPVVTPPVTPAPAAVPKAAVSEGQGDLGLDFARKAEDATLERERLKQGPQTPEVKARIQELTDQLLLSSQSEVEAIRAAKETEIAKAKEDAEILRKFPGLANAPDLMGATDEVKARTQGELFPGEDLGTAPAAAPVVPEPTLKEKAPYQYKLPLRTVLEGRNPNRNLEIPARPGELTPQNIMDTGVTIGSGVRTWADTNLVGKTTPEIQRMVDKDPKLVAGPGQRAKLLRELLAPQPTPFEEPINVQTPAPIPPVQPRDESRTGQPSVEVSGEPAAPVVPQPRARVPRATGRPAAPVGLGLVPTEQPVSPGVTAQGTQPPAIINAPTPPTQVAKPTPAPTVAKAPKAPPAAAPTQVVEDFPEIPQPPSVQRLTNSKSRAEFESALDDLVRIQRSENHPDKDAVGEFIGSNVRHEPFEKALQASEERVRRSTPEPKAKPEPVAEVKWKAPEPKPAPVAEAKPEPKAEVKPEPTPAPVAEAKLAPKVEAKPASEQVAKEHSDQLLVDATWSKDQQGGTRQIVYEDGEVALLRALNLLDKPTYYAVNHEGKVATYPIGSKLSMQPTWLTSEQEKRLVAAKDAAIAKEDALANTHINGPFTAGQIVLATDTVGPAVEGYAKNLMQSLGLGHIRLFIYGKPARSDSGYVDRYKLYGPIARLIKRQKDNLNGSAAPMGKDTYAIYLSPTLSESRALETLTHELGHIVEMTAYDNADAATRKAIQDEYMAWRKQAKLATNRDFMYMLRNREDAEENVRIAELNKNADQPASQALKEFDAYWSSFSEWFADNVSRWATTNEKPLSIADKFFSKVAHMMRDLVAIVTGRKYPPAKSVADFLNKTGPANFAPQANLSASGAQMQSPMKEQFSISVSNADLIKGAGPLDTTEKNALTRLVEGAKAVPTGLSRTTVFRTQTADIAAAIEHRLREKFDGAVRTSLGEINPMGLYRQAQDYTKLLLDFFQQGSLVKDPTLGLWRVTENKNVAPPAKVYELIDAYAKKNGYSREEATQVSSRVLEAARLDQMRLANKNDATKFVIHKINKASTMTADQQIDALMSEYNSDPAFREMNDVMDQARKEMVDHMVAVGRLSAEDGKIWKDVVGYVPFDRLENEKFAASFSKIKKVNGKGLAQLGKLPELVGSDIRPVGNVFDNYINTLGWMVRQVTNTDATAQTVKQLESLNYAKKLGPTPQGRDNTVPIYVGGEQVYYELPSKYDVMAFKDLTPPKAGWVRNLAAVSNVLRKTVTVLPPFALKQVTDDVQRAILTSGVKNPGALLYMALTNFPKMAFAEIRGIQHPSVKDFGSTGLTGEFDFSTGKPALSLLKDLGYKPRGKFETLLHRLEGITRASDLAVRKAIYDQTMVESKDTLLAETRAREFINFRRRGASDFVGTMVATIPFFNAYIQGMDVLYRAASGKDSSSSVDRAQARQLFWSRAGMMVALASLYAMGKDDEDKDYNEMDLRTRDSNWILGGGYKIGVPGELGAIFKVIPERVVEYYKRQGTPQEQEAFEAVRTALTFIAEQYVGRIVPVPQAVKPLIEAWANKSFLTGRELEGYHHKTMDPSMRRTESTSELAIAIANFSRDTVGAEVSPIMIDNALRGYFGSTAALTTAITDSLLNPTRIDRPLHKWALLSNYLYDPVGTRQMTEFYDARDKVGKAGATLRELAKTDTDKAVAYAEQHQDVLVFEKAINGTLNQLEKTRAYRKFLNSTEGAKSMSTDERESEIKQIKETEVEMVKWLREAKVAMRNQ